MSAGSQPNSSSFAMTFCTVAIMKNYYSVTGQSLDSSQFVLLQVENHYTILHFISHAKFTDLYERQLWNTAQLQNIRPVHDHRSSTQAQIRAMNLDTTAVLKC